MAVADDTEAVIDGFTRSACVFAAVAFQQAQPRPVRLAHLLHAPSHLIAAVERDLPCLVTVREPEAAVVSARLATNSARRRRCSAVASSSSHPMRERPYADRSTFTTRAVMNTVVSGTFAAREMMSPRLSLRSVWKATPPDETSTRRTSNSLRAARWRPATTRTDASADAAARAAARYGLRRFTLEISSSTRPSVPPSK